MAPTSSPARFKSSPKVEIAAKHQRMVKFQSVISGTVLALGLLWAGASARCESLAPMVDGNTAFAAKLYVELASTSGTGNLFFSPYSVSSCLGMAEVGAKGDTANEIHRALHFGVSQEGLAVGFKKLDALLLTAPRSGTANKLAIANALCLTGGDAKPDYKLLLKNCFHAEIFRGGLADINAWVKRQTEGNIEKILDQLDPNSALVLLNAIYFKGAWQNPFEESDTREATFHLSPTKAKKAMFMKQVTSVPYLEQGDFQAVLLPYKGNRLSMVILLPRAINGLAGLEKTVLNSNFKGWLAAVRFARSQKVDCSIPRFKLESDYDLRPLCKALGMQKAFDPKAADFSGMAEAKDKLFISLIEHKAVIEVNEEGSVASAATAGVANFGAAPTKLPPPPPIFRADHPFLFLIQDTQTGSILFMGRLVDPAP
jgi:serpin B